jgi:hypothetical protein
METAKVNEQPPPAAVPEPAPAAAPAPAQQPPPPPAEPTETRAVLNPPAGAHEEAPVPRPAHTVTIPAGTLISIRLGETLSSERNQPGDSFSGTLDQPLVVDGFAIAERGARVEGKILELAQAGRVRGLASLAIGLTRLHTADGQSVEIRTESFHKEGPKSTGDDAKKVGVGAAIGAAIGAIAGGGKGAAIGAGVGGAAGAGTVAATRGKPAEIPVETRLRFKLEAPVSVTEKVK